MSEGEVGSPDRWFDAVEAAGPSLVGIVLPLELKSSGHRASQLKGIELLRWLRWSGKGDVRLLPVLAAAWQPLEEILRCVPELLLVGSGTRFIRVPEVLEGKPSIIELFMQQVRTEPVKWCARQEDLDRLAASGTDDLARVSHHDLANEGYAAWRLWAGYLRTLEDAGGKRPPRQLKDRLDWARTVTFDWQTGLLERQRQPSYQQFQIARRATPPPQYPPVPDGPAIVLRHATEGLPPAIRVLLVDDEFDEGVADVLLKILFGDTAFTSKGPGGNEWLYAEERDKGRWIRFVCVKNTAAAYNWLKYWSECDARTDGQAKDDYPNWLRDWASVLGSNQGTAADTGENFGDLFRWGRPALDALAARPAKPVTVVLLDLRLHRGEPEVAYDPTQFASLEFRSAVKDARPDLPVILFTASRQALNYAAAMAQAGLQDGWLTKEAPDVPADDSNSGRAVQYLLERLHLFSLSTDWYRPELGWSSEQMLEFSQLWQRPDRDQLLQSVARTAEVLFESAKAGSISLIPPTQRFIGFVKSAMPAPACAVMPRLVARKLALACLLHTADWEDGTPRWNAVRFQELLPQGRKYLTERPRAVHEVVNFTRDLWFGKGSPFLRSTAEELQWLRSLPWAASAEAFLGKIAADANAPAS